MIVIYEREENSHVYHTVVMDGEGNILEELGQAKESPKQEYGDVGAETKKSEPETKKPESNLSVEQEYDKHGKVIARIFKDENGNTKMSIEYERDEVGEIFHTVIKDEIGNIMEEYWQSGYQEVV